MPGRVEAHAYVVLGLELREPRTTRQGVGDCLLQVVDGHLEVHHHVLVAADAGQVGGVNSSSWKDRATCPSGRRRIT